MSSDETVQLPSSPTSDAAPCGMPPPDPSRADDHLRDIGRGGAAVLFGNLANNGLRFIAMALVGRGLGAATLGAFGWVMNLERFTQVFADAGLPHANLKFVADCLARDDRSGARATARLTATLSFIFSFVLFAALWVLAPAIAAWGHKPELVWPLRIAAAVIPLASITGTLLAVQQAARNVLPLVAIARVGVPLLFLTGVLYVVHVRGSLSALVWVYAGAAGAGLIAAVIVLARWLAGGKGEPKRTVRLRDVLRFSVAMCISAIAGSIITMADVYIVGRFVSPDQLGTYVAATRTAFFVSFPLVAIGALFAPVVSDLFARRDMEGLRHTYATTTRWSTGAAFALLGPMVIAPSLVMGIFGREFRGGGTILILLGLGQLVNCATGGVAWMLAMTGDQAILASTNWACAGVLVGGLILASRAWGAVGAAVCVGGVVAAVNLIRLAWVWRRLRLHPFDARYGLCWLVTTVLIGGLALVARLGGVWAPWSALAAFVVLFSVIGWYGWMAQQNPLALRPRRGAVAAGSPANTGTM